jgi:ribosomal protein S27E
VPTGETFPFTCTQCGHSTTFPIAQFGRTVTCPACRADQVIGGTGRIAIERIETGAIRRAEVAPSTGQVHRTPTGSLLRATPVPSPVPASGNGRLEFVCNNCDHRVVIHASLSGQPVRCAKCGAVQLAGVAGVRVARLDAQGKLPFACGLCGFSTRLAPEYAGKAIKCPKCRAPQVVPKLIKEGSTGISARRSVASRPPDAAATALPAPRTPTPLPGIKSPAPQNPQPPPAAIAPKPPTTLCPTSERPTVAAPPAAMPERMPSAALTPYPAKSAAGAADPGAIAVDDPFEAGATPSGRVVRRRSLAKPGEESSIQAPAADPPPMMPGEATGTRPIDALPPTSALFLSSQAPAFLRWGLIGGAIVLVLATVGSLALWRTEAARREQAEILAVQARDDLAATRAQLQAALDDKGKAEASLQERLAEISLLKTEIEALKDENQVIKDAQAGWGKDEKKGEKK